MVRGTDKGSVPETREPAVKYDGRILKERRPTKALHVFVRIEEWQESWTEEQTSRLQSLDDIAEGVL